jgi:hypothetical protein
MTAYDRYRIQFDISFWKEIWETDLEPLYKEQLENEKQQIALTLQKRIDAKTVDVNTLKQLAETVTVSNLVEEKKL